MDRLRVEAREAVRGLGSRGRTQRIPEAVREKVVAYARSARAQGRSWRRIAGAVGLSVSGVQRWLAAAESPRRGTSLVRVALRPERAGIPGAPGVALVTPAGYRLEGLGLEQAAALLRALG